MRQGLGHTLTELLVVLAAAATLAGLAMPSFAAVLANIRCAAAVGELLAALDTARRVAASRGRPVSVCAVDAGHHCVLNGGRGFAATLADAGPGVDGATSELLDRTLPASQSLASNRAAITFSAGGLAVTPATLTLCDRAWRGAARAIILSRTGRARVSERDAAGQPLACPG